ncbi:tRNA threonylcarbamoyladenosine dehydratase [Neopusillimonas maritima]|uniref:tRNA threonylcarbamoyladenosine dehydratase n=1 Tax=Neopusillimonas maritima TaxID=2026239 RepID=A0A3A1YZW8_9BURK|nr:tRNA threonylcarbamoyladenosine dehydratase [Neopusillimonas maritima]RIY42034.1 tRNA threonylcarbamoyladenosine dehydratase [Neopusillimonas maritima]
MDNFGSSTDVERRFSGLARLYGDDAPERLANSHIGVAGLGGVGSWCAEALARSGVGNLTLIDLDHIAESNINRQVHALTDTLGQSKVEAMAQRIRGINPACRLTNIDDFVAPENVRTVFGEGVRLIIDCTDQISAKVAMILEARHRRIPIIVCGGAGGKTDLPALKVDDLAFSTNDALLAKLRNVLRRNHDFPKGSVSGKARRRVAKMGVRVIWFDQPAVLPAAWVEAEAPAGALQGLTCAGYGSAMALTAAMGLAAANDAIQQVLKKNAKS